MKNSTQPKEQENDTHLVILEAAERLFGQIGFQKTTVADIAHNLRMSPANVYRFFTSKAEIHEAVGREVGMATAYGNLGLVHQMRGEIAQAAAMYAKSIALFRKARAIPQVRQLQRLLDGLTVA